MTEVRALVLLLSGMGLRPAFGSVREFPATPYSDALSHPNLTSGSGVHHLFTRETPQTPRPQDRPKAALLGAVVSSSGVKNFQAILPRAVAPRCGGRRLPGSWDENKPATQAAFG